MARTLWRFGICVILLGWIFHAIFLNEGRLAWERQGGAWSALSHSDQWRVAWTHGPRELWNMLTQISAGALFLSLVFMGLTIFIGVLRWRMVMRVQGLDLPLGRALEISFVAHFFNSFLLGSTGGDLMKAYYAARETHHKKTEAVVTVFVDRLIGLFAMLLFASLMMLPNLHLLGAHRRLAALSALILAMLTACGLLVGVSFWGGLSKGWPRARDYLRRLPKGEWLERSIEACRHFGRASGFLRRTLFLSMILNAACVLQIAAIVSGLGLHIPTQALFVIVPMIICIAALPITPSGLGVRENLYVWTLAVPEIGLDATKALSISLLAYAGSLAWSLVGGLVYATFKDKHHLGDVTQATPDNETNWTPNPRPD